MRKELRPVHEEITCEVCGRTILKGERTEPFIAPSGERHTVCELCTDRAQEAGWIRESAHLDAPAGGRRSEPRRSLLGRFRRRGERELDPLAVETYEPDPGSEVEFAEGPEEASYERATPLPAAERRRDARHVRAIPTNAQVKVERALELFNRSSHVRTIAGITRTLGEPWVTATPATGAPSEVSLVVAWELSWYHYRVDLADVDEPVTLVDKGQELAELDDWMRDWNASALADGRLATGVPAQWRDPGGPDDLLRHPAGARRRTLREDGRVLPRRPERDGDHRSPRGSRPPARRAVRARRAPSAARSPPAPDSRDLPADVGGRVTG